jgi:hypothetical protein
LPKPLPKPSSTIVDIRTRERNNRDRQAAQRRRHRRARRRVLPPVAHRRNAFRDRSADRGIRLTETVELTNVHRHTPIPIFSIGKVASLRPKPGVGASRIPFPVHIQNVGKFVCGRSPFLFDHGCELVAPIALALRLAGLDDIRINSPVSGSTSCSTPATSPSSTMGSTAGNSPA